MSNHLHIIDSHAHVQFPAYDTDREAVIQRAFDAGIGMVTIGTQYSTSESAIKLSEQYSGGVWATVGFHPNHLDRGAPNDPQELRGESHEVFATHKFFELATHPHVVAIGECGLDYYRIKNHESRIMARQQEVFQQQIKLAAEVKKPLVIHCRNAFHDLIQILDSCFKIRDSRPAGVVHFFSGSWDDAKKLLDLGFYLSFGGVITFARDYDEVLKNVPLDRLLVETDAPYVAPVPYRGKRNEPIYIGETVKKVARLRDTDCDEIARQTTANAKQLFGV